MGFRKPTSHLATSTVMPSKCLRARDAFLRLLYPRLLFRLQGTSPPGATHDGWCRIPSPVVDALGHSLSLLPELDLPPMDNPEHLVGAVHNLKPFLPSGCEILGHGDLKITGSRPVDAGGFADIWVGERDDGTKVAIKSHRCYSSSSCSPIYSRLYNEVLTYSRLSNNDKSFVPFIGVYSTREHPFALIFNFMGRRDLRGYLMNTQDIGRLELLLEIACGLKYMHVLGIVHGNVKTTNILVDDDGHVRIAGLGAASILSTMPVENTDRSFYGTAPKLVDPRRWWPADTGATMASDVYAFADLAWEVFAVRSNKAAVAGVHSRLNGRRPTRPDHPELSDRVWKMIKGCWNADPTKRKTITEVVTVLEGSYHRSERR